MAAISPIGNTIYINQNMQNQANLHIGEQNRFELQMLTLIDDFNEKLRVVEEVRAPEEGYGINPDREHEKRKFDTKEEQTNKQAKKEEEIQENQEKNKKEGLLDITI